MSDLFECPEPGCVIFPYDRAEDLDEHVASGNHVYRVGRTRQLRVAGLTGRWVKDGDRWFVEASRAHTGDVVTVEKRDGSTVDAVLVKGHGDGRFDAEPAA